MPHRRGAGGRRFPDGLLVLHRPREDVAAGAVLAAVGVIRRRGNLSNGSWPRFFFDAIGCYLAVGEIRHLLAFRALENRFGAGRHARSLPRCIAQAPLLWLFCGYPTDVGER